MGDERDIRGGETGRETGGGREKNSLQCWATLKVSKAEERSGKCDHSFNLKLSGVNKEYVAGSHRGQDY